jgi:hypothetical protein
MSNLQNSGWMNITDFCIQRRRWQLLNKPPPRLDSLSVNPYLNYTQAQLDMRRKAEVLKYSAVSTNSKTNDLTKAEKYAQMARFAKGGGSFIRMLKLQETCPETERIYAPISSSDVPRNPREGPGPEMMLYMDETVELYNYTRGNTTVATENRKATQESYSTTTYPDAQAGDTVPEIPYVVSHGDIAVASIYSISDEVNREYNYNIPVAFEFANVDGFSGTPAPITVTVSKVYIYVYYNKTLISTNDDTIIFTPVANIPVPDILLDTFNRTSFIITPTSTRFSGHIYLGTVDIRHLQLCNQPSAIYDIRITVVYTNTIYLNGVIQNTNIIQYTTIANVSYREVSYVSDNFIHFDKTRFLSAHISDTTKTDQLITSAIEPITGSLNIATDTDGTIVSIGNNTTTVYLNGDIWWNSPTDFPQTGFINQL